MPRPCLDVLDHVWSVLEPYWYNDRIKLCVHSCELYRDRVAFGCWSGCWMYDLVTVSYDSIRFICEIDTGVRCIFGLIRSFFDRLFINTTIHGHYIRTSLKKHTLSLRIHLNGPSETRIRPRLVRLYVILRKAFRDTNRNCGQLFIPLSINHSKWPTDERSSGTV